MVPSEYVTIFLYQLFSDKVEKSTGVIQIDKLKNWNKWDI